MFIRRLLPTTTALLGALAIAAPVAGASAGPIGPPAVAAPPADVCAAVNSEGAMAVLGPYGPLGDYGPTGAHAGQPNPASGCGGAVSFALPGSTVGSYVNSILSLAGQAPPH